MKRILAPVLIILVVAAGVTGCKKIISSIFPGLDVDAPSVTLILPAIPIVVTQEIPISVTKHFNLDSTVKAKTNGAFGASDVTSVQIKQMNFRISDADLQNNLSNFESVRFVLSSNARSGSVQVAAFTFPDTPNAILDNYTYTTTNPPELISYLQGTELTYDVYAKSRRVTTKALTLTVTVTLHAK